MATSDTMCDTTSEDNLTIDLSGLDVSTCETITVDSSIYIDVDDVYTIGSIDTMNEHQDMIWHDQHGELNITGSIREIKDLILVMKEIITEVAPDIDIERRIEQHHMLKKLSGNE